MSGERTDDGVGRVGESVRLPPAAPPRPEAPAGGASQPVVVERGQVESAPAARAAVTRGGLGRTVAQFIVDPASYEVSVRLIDPKTGAVVREIPPGDLIAMARAGATYHGFLVDQAV